MAKTWILQGKVEGSRIRGRPKKDWMSNITIWSKKKIDELQKERDGRRKFVIGASKMIPKVKSIVFKFYSCQIINFNYR